MINKLLYINKKLLTIIEKLKPYSFTNDKLNINDKDDIIYDIIDIKDDIKILEKELEEKS